RPDSPGRTFGPLLAQPRTTSRLQKALKPACASESPSGLAAAVRLQFGVGSEIGIGIAISQSPGRRRLALLVARKTAIAAASAEIAALDAKWVVPGHSR